MIEPENYTPLSIDQKNHWNDFATHLKSVGGNISDAGKHLEGFKKDNPDTSLTKEMIPHAEYEINQLKTGVEHPTLKPEDLKYAQNLMTPAYKNGNSLMYPVTKDGKHIEEIATGKGGKLPPDTQPLPAPNYDDPNSRLDYAKKFTAKYGNLMQGRGDTPLRINETPYSGSASAKELSTRAATKVGLDPALLYSSAMEEGMSGLFADKKGKVDYSGDEKFPISGFVSFGTDNFSDR